MTDLPTKFNFKETDEKWCRYWEENNTFHAKSNPDKKPFTIVIPPPNVTGILHMGHALNNTLQDIIMRYKRMNGFEALWMPGTDHAGIATQNVVEKKIAKDGKTRDDLGREAFLKEVWDWKEHHGSTIIEQLKRLGASCDWQRERFTMDEGLSNAVKEVFIQLYEKGLIFQGERLINWCPRCHTALSDEEAEHQEDQGKLWHLKYPLKKDPSQFIIVATTRPETMLGDTAVAVNPKDKRYKKLLGEMIMLPLMDREIRIIADDHVDPKFGTGAVKVTPAHDPNDFAIGQRHDLEFINILHPDGRLNENTKQYDNLDRFEGRKSVVKDLERLGLLEKIEDHTHAVGHCYRCHTVVEPYISKQWFVKMKPMAERALEVVKNGKVKIQPKRWEKVYYNWLENIQDWCISRQIWWGHRIPVWYDDQSNCYVARNQEDALKQAETKLGKKVELHQDEDVLDTWFSSWLWPFSTLGWPQKNEDLKFFYPTDDLFTAPEIIFFWVARMIMAGLEFMDDVPFTNVYLHGTVRDSKGRKMSKSLGNALDPIEIIEEYGADALRFSLIVNSGQDLFISKEKFEIGRNFANKIWNASRLILMNISDDVRECDVTQTLEPKDLPSKWIVSKFYSTLDKVSQAVEQYRYSEAESLIYDFFWSNFCDWYLETIKGKFDDIEIQKIVFIILEQSLRMMHPFIPFVTEEIWDHLQKKDREDCLSVASWPKLNKDLIDEDAEKNMSLIIDSITCIRNIRVQWNIPHKNQLKCVLTTNKKLLTILNSNTDLIKTLAKIDDLCITDKDEPIANCAAGVIGHIKVAVLLEGVIDLEKEKARILKQIESQQKACDNLEKRLNNQGFLSKAPDEVVTKEKTRLEALQLQVAELHKVMENLK